MINLFKNLKSRKNNDDKDAYEDFIRIYLDNKKDADRTRKTICFNAKYFSRKNLRIVILEQAAGVNTVAYDSQSASIKDISSPNAPISGFFNPVNNKKMFETVFGGSGLISQEINQNAKIHILRTDNQVLFTLIYASYSQILKKIRSLSHSPSLSRSSSLGDYASLNNLVLNDLGNHQYQKRVAICVTWSCNFDDEMIMKLFFHYIVHFMSILSGLAEKIAQIHQDHGTFSSEKMIRTRHWFTDSFRSIFVSQRLLLPIWLTFSIIDRYSWFSDAGNAQAIKKVFFDKCVDHLLTKYHTKEKNFFLARILTAVLIYHQGWIHCLSPEVYRRHQRLFSCHPGICRLTESYPNNACSQLGSMLLGCGGLTLSRTIVMGSNHFQVDLILYFVSYWLRSFPLIMKEGELLDFTKQPDIKKVSTRRKSASCNDPSESSIASQEDLPRLLYARGDGRGSNSNSIHTVGMRNGSNQYKSSASTGSSPVKDTNERTYKEFFTRDQMICVDQAATEFFYNQRLLPKTSENRKASLCKDNSEFSSPTMPDSRIHVVDLPLVYGREMKVDESNLYRSIGHFNMVAYSDHVVPAVALHGTSDISLPNAPLYEEMKQWLRHAFWMYPSKRNTDFDWNIESLSESFTDRPTSATTILLNADKVTVTLCSVTNDPHSIDSHQRDIVTPSPLILAMLDHLQALIALGTDPCLTIQYLETALTNLYALSVSLASFIRDIKDIGSTTTQSTISRTVLSRVTACHEDDIPILYATALSHSPDICGYEDLLLY